MRTILRSRLWMFAAAFLWLALPALAQQGGYDHYNEQPGWQGGYDNGQRGWTYGRGSGYGPPEEVVEQAINTCQNAAEDRIENDYGARNLRFRDVHVADRDGDLIVGRATGGQLFGFVQSDFRFSCHMDRDLDNVVSVDINRR